MNKALKKYGKSRWAKTRLSKKHSFRRALRIARATMIMSQGLAQMKVLYRSPAYNIEKRAAILKLHLNTIKSINETLND